MKSSGFAVERGQRYRVDNPVGATVSSDDPSTSEAIHELPQGTVVVAAEVRDGASGGQRVRISAPAGWVDGADLVPAEPVPSLWLSAEAFAQSHAKVAPGDHYGIDFPFSIAMLEASGPEFLTTAFRASGAISQQNSVIGFSLEPVTVGGSSERALMSVTYAHPQPGVHTELFAKFPAPDSDLHFTIAAMAEGEVAMERFSRTGLLPLTIPKYYFGDYCSSTGNYIMITERVPFGVPPVEPAYRKGFDHEIPDIPGHYHVLTETLARLGAAHKSGSLGYAVEEVFPFARAARVFGPIRNCEAKVDDLVNFVGKICPHLLPAAATTPAFLEQWREDLIFGLANGDAIARFLHADPDYTALCHPNLNPDNAWFWRDTAGRLHAGLLDWGGAGQMSIAQALSGMLMMPEPKLYLELQQAVITDYVREFHARGGPRLDPDVLRYHYKASLFSTAICTIVESVLPFLAGCTEEDFRDIHDISDERLANSGRGTILKWLHNLLNDWIEGPSPGDVCREILAAGT